MTVWATRDDLVLRFLADNPPEHNILWTQSRSDGPSAGLPEVTEGEFHRSILTLRDAGYVASGTEQYEGGGGCMFPDFQVTGAGKQALGLWPRFDALGSPEELAALLEALGHEAATEEERTNFKKAAGAVRRSAPDVIRAALVGGLSAFARAHLGI